MTQFLVALGLLLYLFMQCLGQFLNLPERVLLVKNPTYALAILLQTVRMLAYFLKVKFIPEKFLLKTVDPHFVADTTVVCIVLFCLLWMMPNSFLDAYNRNAYGILFFLSGLQLLLMGWIAVLAMERNKFQAGVQVVVILIIIAPCLAIAGVYYLTAAVLHVRGDHEIQMLLTASLIPIFASLAIGAFFDKRDAFQNFKGVFVNLFVSLPAIPLCYMLLQLIWPKNLNPILIIVGIVACGIFPAVQWRNKRRPWCLLGRIAVLTEEAPKKDLMEVQAEIKAILLELSSKDLVLKDAVDHNHRADTYRLVGELQTKLMQFIDAEKNFHLAIDSYNDALKIEADNRIAISNKFKTVELLRELERNRF